MRKGKVIVKTWGSKDKAHNEVDSQQFWDKVYENLNGTVKTELVVH